MCEDKLHVSRENVKYIEASDFIESLSTSPHPLFFLSLDASHISQ